MDKRLELHEKLLAFIPTGDNSKRNVYFQPPSNIKMSYPCIVYNKTDKSKQFANDGIFLSQQSYNLMVIERDPDSTVADNIEEHFQHCSITQYYTVDNLNHTTLLLYY